MPKARSSVQIPEVQDAMLNHISKFKVSAHIKPTDTLLVKPMQII